jgi:pilus assembly protein Flp/PilA
MLDRGISLSVQMREYDMSFLRKLGLSDRGATAIEYGLIAALIAVAAITAMSRLGTKLGNTFNNVSGKLVA